MSATSVPTCTCYYKNTFEHIKKRLVDFGYVYDCDEPSDFFAFAQSSLKDVTPNALLSVFQPYLGDGVGFLVVLSTSDCRAHTCVYHLVDRVEEKKLCVEIRGRLNSRVKAVYSIEPGRKVHVAVPEPERADDAAPAPAPVPQDKPIPVPETVAETSTHDEHPVAEPEPTEDPIWPEPETMRPLFSEDTTTTSSSGATEMDFPDLNTKPPSLDLVCEQNKPRSDSDAREEEEEELEGEGEQDRKESWPFCELLLGMRASFMKYARRADRRTRRIVKTVGRLKRKVETMDPVAIRAKRRVHH